VEKSNQKSELEAPPSPDFTIRDEGSILLLTPHTEPARNWITENIGRDNGFQPYFPTIVIERRYVEAILHGIRDSGLEVA
jgi:hypothetical protein